MAEMIVHGSNNFQTLRSPEFLESSKQNNQYKKIKYAFTTKYFVLLVKMCRVL